jgi:oligosaccharide repeat unit polymerase
MLLLIYLAFLFIIFVSCKFYSPSILLICIYLISLIAGYIIGQNYAIDSLYKSFNLLFVAGILTVMIVPWNLYNQKVSISEPDPKLLRFYTIILFIINGIAFLVFMTVFSVVHPEITDYENFKNNGLAADIIKDLNINYILIIFSMYFHVTGYFLVPIHFYYLIKGKYILSIISFMLSLNIAFFGLTVFSRSSIIEYSILYIFYFSLFWKDIKIRLRYLANNRVIISVLIAVTFGFIYLFGFFLKITENRFENLYVKSDSVIDNPAVYYLLDYASQWFKNSNEVMSAYSFETLNGELSFPLLYVIGNRFQLIHYPEGTIDDKLYALWGDHYNTFNGLFANLLYDFGYLGTILFSILYSFLLMILRPINGKLTFSSTIILGVIFIIPGMGIFNHQMRLVVYNALLVYSTIILTFSLIFGHESRLQIKRQAFK